MLSAHAHSPARAFTSSPARFDASPAAYRSPLAPKLQALRADPHKTAHVCTPPPGHQFLTAFDCKYYGTSTIDAGAAEAVSGKQVTKLVKQTITKNGRKHRKVCFRITDKGIRVTSMNDDAAEVDLGAGMLRRIVPGTLKTKSGKTFRVALVIERFPHGGGDDGECTFHVFQFQNPEDVRFMYEASKRMWRDHMFSALLDVGTEAAQTEFDSFVIEQDIETATQRCSKLMQEDMFVFEAALNGVPGAMLRG